MATATDLFGDASSVFETILAVLLVLGVIVGGYYAVRAGGSKQTLAIVNETNDALTAQNAVQKAQIETLEATVATLNAAVAAEKAHSAGQDNEIAQLKELVQGVKAIAVLSRKVDDNHRELIAAIRGAR